jgi:signal transduction histidine kinase
VHGDELIRTHLYRIAQEALNNAIRHGKASRVSIRLNRDKARLALTVTDNGTGLPPDRQSSKGMGLKLMEYRAGIVGGSLTVRRRNGKTGTQVVCTVPKHATAQEKD